MEPTFTRKLNVHDYSLQCLPCRHCAVHDILPIHAVRHNEKESLTMLKFLGSTIGIIFLIGLIVVIALFKFIF